MSLHKLTAGDGYTYLTRQVAAMDATDRGHGGLGDYYSQRGESPGTWTGSGLAGLADLDVGHQVDEVQMKALFGQGLHPDAERLEREAGAAGRTQEQARAAGALGSPFPVYSTPVDGFRARCADEFAAANAARGQPKRAPLPEGDRARIRGEVARRMFTAAYDRSAADERELAGFIARESRSATTAVAGYDLTFSPVKSVSALWALAPRAVAEQIEAAHHAAVADTLTWLEQHASFTRLGAGGVRQVETTGLIAAVFTHRDSRAGDPDLHTHAAVSNKVQTLDGRWRALDGRLLYKANVAASERYNTRLETHLVAALGLQFAERPGGDRGKRSVRELVGLAPQLLSAWSSRRQMIDARRGQLSAAFQATHGRHPTTPEAIALAQQATLDTRAAKHEPRSLAKQRADWRGQALAVLGGEPQLTTMLVRTLRRRQPRRSPGVSDAWIQSASRQALETVSQQRASWQYWHVRAEAERIARAADMPSGDVDRAVTEMTAMALSTELSIPLDYPETVVDPPELRRSDGTSVYTVAHSRLYSSRAVLNAETDLVAAAGQVDGRRADPAVVELALLEASRDGHPLNIGQQQLVRDLASSGARLQVAVAPAGAGKTTGLAALARAWTASGGHVLGLSPSAVGAAELQGSLGSSCETLAKLMWSIDETMRPDWVATVGPDALVVIDEAGMAGTVELARAVAFIVGRGGSVRLVGDPQQLTSVAAGGVLAEIAAVHGALSLTQLMRFADPSEGAATVALRAGDTTSLGFYLDNGRVHVGDLATCAEHAYAAWAADRRRGVDALLLAATRELVVQLNDRARADRLSADHQPAGREVAFADGTRASAGDVVITRCNDRALRLGGTNWVKNGDRFVVRQAWDDGALAVVQVGTGRRVTLPAAYVSQHVQLGYATTVHGAQGVTADTSHTVLTGTESRQLLYVALSRGRAANHVYLSTVGDGDPHTVITPAAVEPPTATDLLVAMLARDGAQTSATQSRRELAAPQHQLHTAATRYTDAVTFAADHRLDADIAEALDNAAESARLGLTTAAAWPTLRGRLALLAATGSDPVETLIGAVGVRELSTAGDPAAVLDWRLPAAGPPGPLPWLPGIPESLLDDPHWGAYLTARADQVTDCARRVAEAAVTMTQATAPDWSRRLLGQQHESARSRLAVWRACFNIPGDDRRPTGPPRPATAERRHQKTLDAAVEATCSTQHSSVWDALADSIDPRIRSDSHWDELAERLVTADRTGVDAAGLLAAVACAAPLPDDLPAAAVWWRLIAHLSPASTRDPAGTAAGVPRPQWYATLLSQLPAVASDRLVADASWPALVAAITGGIRAGWTATDLLGAAVSRLTEWDSSEATGRRLVDGLVIRVAALTDPVPDREPEPLEPDLEPPDDAHLLTPGEDLTVALALADTGPTRDHHTAAEETYGFDQIIDEPTPDEADYLLELHFWATAVVSRNRLVELNRQASAFFAGEYPSSWASRHLRDRLGSDLIGDARFSPGFAPAGWTALTQHLRGRGATDTELLGAGLAQRARTGSVIDRFRDRLTFPIHDTTGDVVGFIARRNPDDPDDGRVGPKYLNTPGTDLYTKGEHLFGLHESRVALKNGSALAIAEGPIDALAITLAGDGRTVGVACLGTALTDQQADLLRPHINADGPGVLVATDNDAAGDESARRMFWQLTARGDAPRRLCLPDGMDPAELLRRDGVAALEAAVQASDSLAIALLEAGRTIEVQNDDGSGLQKSVLNAATIIAALPPTRWLRPIDGVTEALGLTHGVLHQAILDTASNTSALRLSDCPRPALPLQSNPGVKHVVRAVRSGGVGPLGP